MKKDVTLRINPIGPFFSDGDEECFFQWLDQIKCIKGYEGSGESLSIAVDTSLLEDNELREIIALLYRYDIDMKQLAVFDCAKFSKWFRNKEMFWHDRVFGSRP